LLPLPGPQDLLLHHAPRIFCCTAAVLAARHQFSPRTSSSCHKDLDTREPPLLSHGSEQSVCSLNAPRNDLHGYAPD
jgi:hypothetical protein